MFRVFIFGVFQTIYIYDDYFKYAADNRALKAEAPLHLLQYATLLASGRRGTRPGDNLSDRCLPH